MSTTPSAPRTPRRPLVRGGQPWLTPGRLIALVAVLVASYAAVTVVVALRTVLVMLLVSFFLASAVEPAVQYLSRHGMKRNIATAVTFVGLVLVVLGVLGAFVPLIVGQLDQLSQMIPGSVADANRLLQSLPFGIDLAVPADVERRLGSVEDVLGGELQQVALGAAGSVVDVGATFIGVFIQVSTVMLVTYYLVADGPKARRVLAAPLPQERQRELLTIWELAVEKTGGYFYSRVLLAVVGAGATALFLFVLGVPSPLPLGIFVGVCSTFIPVVGTILGGFLPILVAGISNPIDALWVLIFLLVYQQLENLFIGPRIQARTMNVHPAVALVSVLVGATLLGAVGALLALPATAIIQALLSTYVRRHVLIDEFDELDEVPLPVQPAPEPPAPGPADPVRAAIDPEVPA